jgi:hypothetical protein
MSIINTVTNTGSQLTTNYDLTKMFLGANRFKNGAFKNTTGDTLTIPSGTLLGKVTTLVDNGTKEVSTGTVVGTIDVSGAGNANVIVRGAHIAGSPLTIPVAVANSDSATAVAGKVRTAMNIVAITANYTISGTGAVITLTSKTELANDATLSVEVKNDTCTGLTDETGTVTTPGVAESDPNIVGYLLPFKSIGVNGENIPVGILNQDLVVAAGAVIPTVNYCIAGDFDNSKLILQNTDTLDTIVNGQAVREAIIAETQLIGLDISQMSGYDNQ